MRRDGRIVEVPNAYRTRRIDLGDGEKPTMTIPWGDVSTAYYTTGIPNIEVYFATSSIIIAAVKSGNYTRRVLASCPVQAFLKGLAGRLKGPDAEQRSRFPTYVWGEAINARGQKKTARIRTANGYDVTVTGSLAVVAHLLAHGGAFGSTTPAKLMGAELVTNLPGSGPLTIS